MKSYVQFYWFTIVTCLLGTLTTRIWSQEHSGCWPCAVNHFQCNNCRCILKSWLCNRANDCGDGSDEHSNCTYPACSAHEFTCKNNRCVHQSWVCDGSDDCTDGSDEVGCRKKSCPGWQWTCPNSGKCIPISKVCDGSNDCKDGSDETSSCGVSRCSMLACGHGCQKTPSGGQCYCPNGETLDIADNRTCIDFDECSSWGYCDQKCENQAGSYTCSCYDGYTLKDNKHCTLNNSESMLLLVGTSKRIISINSTGSNIIPRVSASAFDIEVNYAKNKLYWIDYNEKIYEVDINGEHNKTELPIIGLGLPYRLALDWVTNTLYFLDKFRRIGIYCLDTGYQRSIITDDIYDPNGLAIDPTTGYLFFSDPRITLRTTGRIVRAFMDGSHRMTLRLDKILNPIYLTLDIVNKRLYWIDYYLDHIQTVDYDGRFRHTIISGGLNIPSPVSLSLFENQVFWADTTKMGILKVNKYDGLSSVSQIFRNTLEEKIKTIKVYHPSTQMKSKNPCKNANCEQICILTHTSENAGLGYKCLCQAGYELMENQVNCTKMDKFLLFVCNYAVRGIPLTSSTTNEVDAIPPILASHKLRSSYVAIDYLVTDEMIFFSDVIQQVIYKGYLNGTGIEPLITHGLGTVVGIAVDWTTRNLYFTESLHGSISVARIDHPEDRRVLISNIGYPRAICINPYRGWIFYTDWLRNGMQNAYIARANSDGTDIVRIRRYELGWPNGLSIDYSAQRLYWADAYFHRIQHSDFDGKNTETLSGHTISHPFGIAVYKDNIYITDWRLRSLLRMNKNGRNQITLRSSIDAMMDIKIYDKDLQVESAHLPCNRRNGDCSHFCFPIDSGEMRVPKSHCGCPYGLKLDKNLRTCIPNPDEGPQHICSNTTFQCANKRCIHPIYRCDGDNDCIDNSDETDCPADRTCSPDHFQCQDKMCISKFWVCDGDFDCRDHSDELNCTTSIKCTSREFQCNNSLCISLHFKCNTENDCGDGSDEGPFCSEHTCLPGYFQCDNKICISENAQCDGDNDCFDNSDERGCSPLNCTESQWKCQSEHQCIYKEERCDGSLDCRDRSDEAGCPPQTGVCRPDYFKCLQGGCIPVSWKCDGKVDCENGSDENSACPPPVCPNDWFRCKNGRCIYPPWTCDGEDDCGDNSDEDKELTCPPPPFYCPYRQWQCPGGSRTCIPDAKVCDGNPDCPGGHDESPLCNTDNCLFDNGGCSNMCIQTPLGAQCQCPPGEELNGTKVCMDKNECEPPGHCSQRCQNTIGSFKCHCDVGYQLLSDRRTCRILRNETEPKLFMLSRRQYVESTTDFRVFYHMTPNFPARSMITIDVDVANSSLYIGDILLGLIFEADPYGQSFRKVITNGIRHLRDIAVDWISRSIYWSDLASETIEVATLKGENRMIVVKGEPNRIALDPREGSRFLFWVHFFNSNIIRCGLDGSNSTVIVSEKVHTVANLVIDYPNKRIYFIDDHLDYIDYCDYNGKHRHRVLSSPHLIQYAKGIAILEDRVYWVDSKTARIYHCNKFNGDDQESTYSIPTHCEDMVIHSKVSQPASSNPCFQSPCSHLCLLSPVNPGYTCGCPRSMHISSDGNNCVMDKSEFLIYTYHNSILSYSFDNLTEPSLVSLIPPHPIQYTDFDYDSVKGYIYYLEKGYSSVVLKKKTFAGLNISSVWPNFFQTNPDKIAIDWVSRNIFWISKSARDIEVMKLDGDAPYHKIILENSDHPSGVFNPDSICLDPVKGFVYWIDLGGGYVPKKIAEVRMDGSDSKILIKDNLDSPKYLTKDPAAPVLYWSEHYLEKIQRYDISRKQREVVLENLAHPGGLAVYKGFLFYVENGRQTLSRISLTALENGGETFDKYMRYAGALRVFYERHLSNDTNSCAGSNYGGCSQLCLPNGLNTHKCECNTGLTKAQGVCKAGSSFLLVATHTTIKGYSLESNDYPEAMIPYVTRGRNHACAFTYMKEKYIYVSSYNGKLARFAPDGSKLETFDTDRSSYFHVTRMAIDWLAGNLYYLKVGSDTAVLEVSRLDGSNILFLLEDNRHHIYSFCVNPIKRYIYWTGISKGARIERALLDGSNRTILVRNGIVSPLGITVDILTHKVYWVDIKTDSLQRISYNGGNREYVRGNLVTPIDVTIVGNNVYWLDSSLNKIFTVPKNSKVGAPSVVKSHISELRFVSPYDATTQPEVSNPCTENNGGCEHLCFSFPNNSTAVCKCSVGKLGPDGNTCTHPEEFLLYTSGDSLRSISLDRTDHSNPVPPLKGIGDPQSVDYDYKESYIYFTQYKTSKLSRVQKGSTTVEDIGIFTNNSRRYRYGGLHTRYGLAVDWVGRKIYWTDLVLKKIASMNFDSTYKVTLAHVDRPHAIVLDPCKGYMYWITLNNHNSKIERATMAGNQRTTLLSYLAHPYGLAIDYKDEKLYWSDTFVNTIERSNLDGNYKEVIVDASVSPNSITVFGNHIYWSDWETRGIYRAEKHTGDNKVIMISNLRSPARNIKVYSEQLQTCSDDPCQLFNGGCSHGCHPAPDGKAECSCDDDSGLVLANDQKMCVTKENNCTSANFICMNGKCIYKIWKCDIDDDCGDGSDEHPNLCAQHTCDPSLFRCDNGRCIIHHLRCDYDNDCRDNSDERDCGHRTCGPNEFECKNFRCIPEHRVCDGYDHCRDGSQSDEQNCSNSTTCRSDEVKCPNNNICLSSRFLCDGDNDCGDNSDENELFCQSVTCSPNDFFCTNRHRCIPAAWHCDGLNDCGDNEDEPPTCGNQTCYGNAFTCNSGKCISHLWVCDGDNDCLDGSDEDESLNCGDRTCPPDYFTCKANNQSGRNPCISQRFVCDGIRNCVDGEDEMQSCEPITCSSDQFACDNGFCVRSTFLCDHDNDCGDNSDEPSTCEYPTCRHDQFQCGNQRCILQRWVCDMDNDCHDNSDENASMCFTPAPTCPPGQYLCKNGECINYSIVCNKVPDCSDGSDEEHCYINECESTSQNQCQHKCVDTITSFHCECQTGFALMSDKKACEDIDECNGNPEPCSQKCLNTVGNFTCKCNDGYMREPDGRTCKKKDSITPWLIFGNRYYIRELSTDGQIYRLVVQGLSWGLALDYDYKEQRVYFVNRRNHVQRMFLNGTNRETIINSNMIFIEGIAIDWVGRKLYLADRVLKGIFVTELNGTNHVQLVSLVKWNSKPSAIIVDPKHGYIYYTAWGSKAFIGRVGMDGSGHTFIITEKIAYPDSLIMDYETNKIWWADSHLKYIDYVNADGTGRRTVLQNGFLDNAGITIFEDWIYWTDMIQKSVEKAHKYTGANHVVLKNTTHYPTNIKVIHPLIQKPHTNPCGTNNGGCSHLCLLAPGNKYTCACPTDFLMSSDNRTCIANCSSNQFRCGVTDDQCIWLSWKCDGEEDCKDGSDEPEDCPELICTIGEFRCRNSNCTLSFHVCDQHDDCGDGSDEENCEEFQCLQWKCNNNKCIPFSWRCDGEDDCGDSSDESPEKCVNTTCDPSQFTCDDGACIAMSWTCDFDQDCLDGSDESEDLNCTNRTCPPSRFKCATNYRCIPHSYLCDGEIDCHDSSDEAIENCPSCDPDQHFQCSNHRCIPKRWQCDFDDDCGDNSDETNCRDKFRQCSESEFQCANQICIQSRWRCDNDDDCGDESDETNCGPVPCSEDQFRCNDRHCISKRAVCDGHKDCIDVSDESNCTARYPNGKYCPPNVFECKNTICIPLNWRCDGVDDCGDGSDEVASVCKKISCPTETHFRCDNFKCIPHWQLCNKIDNCGDASDENNHRRFVSLEPPLSREGDEKDNCQPVRQRCEGNQFKCKDHQCIDSNKVCDDFKDCEDASDEEGCDKSTGIVNCTVNNGGCAQDCTDLKAGGYYCSCKKGYQVSSTNRKQCDDIDECAQWGTNFCPQVCINLKGTYKCNCANGFRKWSSGYICKAHSMVPFMRIHFTMGTEIRGIEHGGKYVEESSSDRPQALDFNPGPSILYWTDLVSKSIYRAYVKYQAGPAMKLDIFGLQEPNGIGVDWISGNIYWTDTKRKSISVAAYDGRYRRTVIKNGLRKPYALAISGITGWMYWTDIDSGQPTIERAWMNGQNQEVLVSKRLAYPTGITIDYYMDSRIFWCDPKLNVIESMRANGTDRVIVVNKGLQNPVSLDVFSEHLYWLSQGSNKLYKMDKFGRGVNITLQNRLHLPRTIAVSQPNLFIRDVKSKCYHKSTCSHLCIPLPDGHECMCPDNSKLLPGSNTVCNAAFETAVELVHCECKNGGTCVQLADKTYECRCSTGFYGKDCTSLTPEKLIGQLEYTKVAAIAVPVVLFIIIAAVSVAGFFAMKKRGKFFLSKPSIGGPSVPHTPLGVVSFRDGDDVNIGTPPLSYDITSGQVINPLENEYSTAEPTCPTNFSNPMYGVDSATKTGQRQKKAPSPPAKQSLEKNESISSETIDSSKKTPEAKSKKENLYVSLKSSRAFDPTEDTDTDTAGLVKMGEL